DNGLYVSFNQGTTWEVFQNGLPHVAIHDLVIQPEAKHLLVGTHGRSIYKAEIAHLQQMTPAIIAKVLHVFALKNIKHSERWGGARSSWMMPNTPGLDLTFYSKSAAAYTAMIKTEDGIVVSETEIDADKGLNILSYDLAFSKAGKLAYLKKHKTELREANDGKTYLLKGSYSIELNGNGSAEKATFEIN
ncbi:MAG: glycosyl hydrolase, partial [Flavobacteriaceae bacterium]